MEQRPFRRIVTGHDDDKMAIVLEDGPPPRVLEIGNGIALFYEVWNTRESPVGIDRRSSEPAESGVTLAPPPGGTRIRIIDIAPEPDEVAALSPEDAAATFAEFGGADAATHGGSGSAHALMHRTETVDYGIVLEGEITLILDRGETVARAGDIVIQRGTNHAWANRSGRICRMAFILIDGKFDQDLR